MFLTLKVMNMKKSEADVIICCLQRKGRRWIKAFTSLNLLHLQQSFYLKLSQWCWFTFLQILGTQLKINRWYSVCYKYQEQTAKLGNKWNFYWDYDNFENYASFALSLRYNRVWTQATTISDTSFQRRLIHVFLSAFRLRL